MDIKIDDIVKTVISVANARIRETEDKTPAIQTAAAEVPVHQASSSKIAVLAEPGAYQFETVNIPPLKEDEILVRISGSVLTSEDAGEFLKESKAMTRRPCGFQGTGVIVKTGKSGLLDAEKKVLHEGDRVIRLRRSEAVYSYYAGNRQGKPLDSWFAEYIIIKAGNDVLAVNELKQESRLLAGQFTAVSSAMERACQGGRRLTKDSRVVVAGCTFIGYITMAVLKTMGIRPLVIGGDDESRHMAEGFGAGDMVNYRAAGGVDAVVQKVRRYFSGDLADTVFYCAESDMGLTFARRLGVKNALLCDLGSSLGKVKSASRFGTDSIVSGTHNYSLADYKKAITILENAETEGLPIYRLITHRYRLDELNEALWTYVRGEGLGIAVLNR